MRRVWLSTTSLLCVLAAHALACKCAPPAPPPPGHAPALILPPLDDDSAVFAGVVESLYPESLSAYLTEWRRVFGRDLSEKEPVSPSDLRDFMLRWASFYSPDELTKIRAATTIEDLQSASRFLLYRRVRFKVKEVFSGTSGKTIDVLTGLAGGDCGVNFRRGEPWLVDAYSAGAGRWIVTVCSQTKPLSKATPIVDALRAKREGKH